MMEQIATRLGTHPNPAHIVLLFFAYSFLGYLLECAVLTADKKRLVINRGFVRHLPFCIIYGFGALIGFALLAPFANNLPLLFVVGAITATGFEYIVGRLQLALFGDFWWDYSEKPFNYKGMLCLESTIGWGVVAIVIIRFLHMTMVGAVRNVPGMLVVPLAAVLVAVYILDFIISARHALQQQRHANEEKLGERTEWN